MLDQYCIVPNRKALDYIFYSYSSWLRLKVISVHIAAKLRAMWALLFWPKWPAAVDRILFFDKRSFR